MISKSAKAALLSPHLGPFDDPNWRQFSEVAACALGTEGGPDIKSYKIMACL